MASPQRRDLLAPSVIALLIAGMSPAADVASGTPPPEPPDLRAAVEAGWARQEERLGREAADPAALAAAAERLSKIVDDLRDRAAPSVVRDAEAALAAYRARASETGSGSDDDRIGAYRTIRWAARRLALANPLLRGRPIAFLERRRFICQMLHEYVAWFYDLGDVEGGGVRVLEHPGESFATRDLTADRLGRGNFTTLSVSHDARTLYFAFAPRAREKCDWYSPERRCFHLWSVPADGSAPPRQLTYGPDDDFDPCELPNGDLVFLSTRRGGYTRCNNPWEPIPTYTLHRMDRDGGIRTLSFHETNEWHPSLLLDGRIVYTRWDYVDRSAANFHGLWVSNPDGTGAAALFGNYTARINACFQPRPVPGSRRIAFIAGAHHADVGGALCLVDPARTALDPKTGEDRFEAIEVLTPEVCFPEAPGWPSSWFHSPWPLSETWYLVSFSFDPLPGMSAKTNEDTRTGIYLFDRFGGLELLVRRPDISCMYPIPLEPRPARPEIASALDPSMGQEGEFLLTDVHRSHFPLPAERRIRELRVFQIFPKSRTHSANDPRIGHANAESVRMLLGTVPVEEDGSAYFRAPARKPLYFQAVDGTGRAVQGMRSAVYLQPGERRGCVGCHEPPGEAPPTRVPVAHRRPPSTIRPGPDGTRPWSFARLVQPVLDARCVRCHGGDETTPPLLDALPEDGFTRSYHALRPYARWYEWGGEGIDAFVVTRPGRMPADESDLLRVLGDERHADLGLTDEERLRLILWLDGNAAFYGSYGEDERLAQRRGEAVPHPALE